MRPNRAYLGQPCEFWAVVRFTSQSLGYSDRSNQRMRRYEDKEILNLADEFAIDDRLAEAVRGYLNYRADLIEREIEPLFMDRSQAEEIFAGLLSKYKPACALPFNKQKGQKRHYNYLSCIVNMLTEHYLNGKRFDDEPRSLCVITDRNNKPLVTLSRWMDGAYPDVHNPVAVWETKEYYGTTTFGSRVADGVYESLLDGYEIREAEKLLGRRIEHYLFVDDKFTWWVKGKSYICRLIDMMHMALVDEVIFGKESLTRWPQIVSAWS